MGSSIGRESRPHLIIQKGSQNDRNQVIKNPITTVISDQEEGIKTKYDVLQCPSTFKQRYLYSLSVTPTRPDTPAIGKVNEEAMIFTIVDKIHL